MQEIFNEKTQKMLVGLKIVRVKNDLIIFNNGLAILLDNNTIRELNNIELNEVAS